MKVLIFLTIVACAFAFPQNDHNHRDVREKETTTWVPILKYNKEQGQDGSYKTEYQTGNNIAAEETGYLKDFSETNPNGILVQQGAYSYEAPDGQIINVEYIADEQGFRVNSDSLPTTPAPSPEIQKALDLIYAGIKAQKERREQEAKSNPKFAEEEAERARLNYNGQYYQRK